MATPSGAPAPSSQQLEKRDWLWFLLIALPWAGVVMAALDQTGMLSADEPRYAWIGRHMAESGDWITPVLWDSPWFEKPPLLYWLMAMGHAFGLRDELAARLPVALLSLAFLTLFFFVLRRVWNGVTAIIATAILATSCGWVALSEVGVTDLPLAATFGATVLLALWRLHDGPAWTVPAAGVAFGLSLLAKGLVPMVLLVPMVWFFRRRWRELALALGVGLLVAMPWYGAMLARHGSAFFNEFIIRHHFSRFASKELQHVQPFWFFVPVGLAALYPWTPVVFALRRSLWSEGTFRTIGALFLFGLLFFSASRNKLATYFLPLLPWLCALLGRAVATAEAKRLRVPLAISAMLLAITPLMGSVLPTALMSGLSRANWGALPFEYVLVAVPIAAAAWWLDRLEWRVAAVAVITSATLLAMLYVKLSAFPVLDQVVSARGLWRKVEPHRNEVCVDFLHRSLRYGLNYYSRTPLPDCAQSPRPLHLVQPSSGIPALRVEPGHPNSR